MSTKYIVKDTLTSEELGIRSSKKAAIALAEASGTHCTIVTNTGTEVWKTEGPAPEPTPVEKRVYKRATRATEQPATARTGKFDLATYGNDGETRYAQRPDAQLRLELGIKWVELWDLGVTQRKATELLKQLAAGETTIEKILAPLDLDGEGE